MRGASAPPHLNVGPPLMTIITYYDRSPPRQFTSIKPTTRRKEEHNRKDLRMVYEKKQLT